MGDGEWQDARTQKAKTHPFFQLLDSRRKFNIEAVISALKLVPVAFRCIRSLVHAIGYHGNPWEIVNTPKSAIRDPHVAAALLEKWWPSQLHLKEYDWPNDGDYGRGPDFGDVGVFDSLYPPKFRKLTNIKDDMPTYLFLGNKNHKEVVMNGEKPMDNLECKLLDCLVYRWVSSVNIYVRLTPRGPIGRR